MLLSVMMLLQAASDSSSPDSWTIIGPLVGTSPVAAVLAWQLIKREKEIQTLQTDLAETRDQQIKLAERALPILTEATQALREAARGYGVALDRAQAMEPARDIQQRRNEMAVDALSDHLKSVETMVNEMKALKASEKQKVEETTRSTVEEVLRQIAGE